MTIDVEAGGQTTQQQQGGGNSRDADGGFSAFMAFIESPSTEGVPTNPHKTIMEGGARLVEHFWNKEGEDDPIIPAYNTPEHKYNLGVVGRDIHLSATKNILRDFSFSINYKWVEEFIFEGSPQFTGIVPTYDLVDMQISKKLQQLNATIKVGSSNLLNNMHYEVYGGPYIGRMTYCSLLFDIK